MYSKKVVIEQIDEKIKSLLKQREYLITKMLGADKLIGGTWVIHRETNTYYQFAWLSGVIVTLIRHGEDSTLLKSYFDSHYRVASKQEVEQHMEHLSRKGIHYLASIVKFRNIEAYKVEHNISCDTPSINPLKCEFYMVTCKGEQGSKVRHANYESAEKEAKRIAALNNHETWIVGVVASIKPVITTAFEVKKKF